MLGKKCYKDHVRNPDGTVALWLTDKNVDTSEWVTILMVSAECRILRQADLADMQKENHVLMKWPEYGGISTRYMHQVSPLLWVANEILMEPGPLHMIDPFVDLRPKET